VNLEENLIYQQAVQMQTLQGLHPKQRARLQAYMRLGGLTFDEAHAAVLRTDPVDGLAGLIRLARINLPPPRPSKGRKLTRRQRRHR